jgi:hypothetical protein
MVKRVFVFIVSLAALVSIGLVKCAGNMPYADSVLSMDSTWSDAHSPTGMVVHVVISGLTAETAAGSPPVSASVHR